MMNEWRNSLTAHDALMSAICNTAFCGQLEAGRSYTGPELAQAYKKVAAADTLTEKIEKRMVEIVLSRYVICVTPKNITHVLSGYFCHAAKEVPLVEIFNEAQQQLIEESNN